MNFLKILLFSPFVFPVFVFLDTRDFIENFQEASCSSCNQRWCARYNQMGTYSQCRDHPINRKILNESKK